MNTTIKPSNRVMYLDFIKVIAIFMVLYNHRATYNLAQELNVLSPPYYILQFLATLCRCGVPLFFMASGVLLLKKKESTVNILRHRVVRILLVMVLCALIRTWPDYTLANLLTTFFTRLNWYLYAYLDYLLMLPFLRHIAAAASKSEARLFFILSMTFYTIGGCLIYFNYYIGLIEFAPIYNTQFSSLCWGIIFPLIGFFFETYPQLLGRYTNLILLIMAGVSLFLSVFFVVSDLQLNNGANIEHLRTHFIFAPSCLLFIVVKNMYEKASLFHNNIMSSIVTCISSTTFGIFIIETHSELINYINWKLVPMTDILGSYKTGLLSVVLQFIACFTITYLIKRIPFLKKLI